MKKLSMMMGVCLILISLTTSCDSSTERRDFCECNDIQELMTEEFTLSENEKESKQKACEWINEEMSQVEQIQAMKKCLDEKNHQIK